jgi:predicted enzyme related to lactoylglutathione lyase
MGTSWSFTNESLPEELRQMIKGIAFTGSSVTDMKRARAFYENVLGLNPSEEMAGGKWIEYEVGGGTFAITNIDPEWTPSEQGTAIAFEVDDMDVTIGKLKKSGAKFFLDKSETPVCWTAIIYDPDRNKVVIHKRKAG